MGSLSSLDIFLLLPDGGTRGERGRVEGLRRLRVADNYHGGKIAVDQVQPTSNALRRGLNNYQTTAPQSNY